MTGNPLLVEPLRLNTEFPVINSFYQGQKNQFSYHVLFPQGGREEPRFPGLVKYDLETGGYVAYSAGPRYFYNEPGSAPRDHSSAEDDGWLITFVHDVPEGKAELVILDAQDFNRPPVARVLLPQRIPYGFHGTWVSTSR